jgi:uncharacterized protein (DUF58 family)
VARSRAAAGASGARFLDPEVLARIDNLDLLARTVVDGFLAGLHRSPYLGLSLDFAEHRPYMPGDDIRRIDWRLFARTDRHYIKLFEAETNADFAVLLDVSRSMSYGSGEVTKLDYARYLAACLTYFSRRQRDRVGLLTFDDEVVEFVPPSARNLDRCLHALDRARPADPGSLEAPLLTAAERLRRTGILVVLSDLYEPVDQVVRSIRLLAGRGHDIVVFHVLDPAELTFPFDEATSFRDLESGEELPVRAGKHRETYRERLEAHREALATRLTAHRVDYELLDTSRPLDHALFRYLVARERRARTR